MTEPLASLPLFATDKQIAVAIVGKERAAYYIKEVILVRTVTSENRAPYSAPLCSLVHSGYFIAS